MYGLLKGFLIFTCICLILIISAIVMSEKWQKTTNPVNPKMKGGIFEDSNLAMLIQHAKKLLRQRKKVLLVTVNAAELSFAHNWLCITKNMTPIHDQVILLATEQTAAQSLHKTWPKLKIIYSPIHLTKEERVWGSKWYQLHRLEFLLQILESGIEFLLFEPDTIWLRNPLPLINHATGLDFLVARRNNSKNYMNDEPSLSFIYIRATTASTTLWKELFWRMRQNLEKDTDQSSLNKLLKANFPRSRWKYFQWEEVCDENWYTVEQKNKMNPFVVYHSERLDNSQKKNLMKTRGVWLLQRLWISWGLMTPFCCEAWIPKQMTAPLNKKASLP